jgi:serine protease Do
MPRFALVAGLLLASSAAFAAPPKPSGPPGSAPSAAGPKAETPDPSAVLRGVVQVERAGRPVAVGTVLAKDGRVITSLSALGSSEQLDVRYDDGTVVKTRLGHKDPTWDLALLVPQSGRWLEGLSPTNDDPSGAELKAFLPKGKKLGAHAIALHGRIDARSKSGEPLKSVLELDLTGAPDVVGAPVVDGSGSVVGVLGRACKSDETADGAPETPKKKPAAKGPGAATAQCAPVTIGAPVYALRGFLMRTPATAVAPQPWLGLGGAPAASGNVRGVRVMGIAPGSPAEKAGLKVDAENPDTIVAVDGQPVETPEQLAEVLSKRAIGRQIKLLVFSGGKFREVPVTLRAAP